MHAKQKNIFLTGMMGSGKTTIGKEVATMLQYIFVDTDSEIEKRWQLSVAEIFNQHGEARFRKEECAELGKIIARERQVIATGGGMLADQENLRLAQKHGLVIFLETSMKELARRITSDGNRPLITETNRTEQLAQIYKKRKDVYDQIELKINTDEYSIAAAASAVVTAFNSWTKE